MNNDEDIFETNPICDDDCVFSTSSLASSATLSFRRVKRVFKAISSDDQNESDDARVTNENNRRR